ncbi:MAG: cell division protein, partial [Solibacillus sp.]
QVPTADMIANELNLLLEEKAVVVFQKEQVELVKTAREFFINGKVVKKDASVPNGATIKILEKDTSKWIYQDVFRFSSWQLPTAFKGSFTIIRNGQPSSFDAEIFGGDQLEIQLIEQVVEK